MNKGYKTVLILGAGVSNFYGFPLARDLLKLMGNLRLDGAFQSYARKYASAIADLDIFFDATQIPYHGTIDEYLRKNSRHVSVGLAAIAFLILRHEQRLDPAAVVSPQSFYRTLFDLLKLDPEMGKPAHDVSIITLNYDRSLEYWMQRLIDLCVGEADKSSARTRWEAVRIHHLHNSLGSLDQLPYFSQPTEETVHAASTRLMTIHRRDTALEESYATARAMMQSAAMVFVLGCSYDPTIFGKLFAGLQDGGFYSRTGIMRIFGTVVGHDQDMAQRIRKIFGSDDLIQAKPSEHPAVFVPRAASEFHQLALERAAAAWPR